MSAPIASFIDHYQVLGVEMTASTEEIYNAYQTLAARYHPNSRATADPEKFAAVNGSYQVLADPEAKAAFDAVRGGGQKEEKIPPFNPAAFYERLTVDSNRRLALLSMLYYRRCTAPRTPSIPYRVIEKVVKIDNDQLTLAVWFLKEKGYIVSDDKSALVITVGGIEYLERAAPTPEMILPFLTEQGEAGKSDPAPAQASAAPAGANKEPSTEAAQSESVLSKLKINLPPRTDGPQIRIPRPVTRPKAPPAM